MNEPLFNISRESLKNAVREVISEKIDKDYIDCCIDGLIDEQKVKINRKVDEMIDGITVEQTRVDQWISAKWIEIWNPRYAMLSFDRPSD